jgi:GT2 family glycosyltransferase
VVSFVIVSHGHENDVRNLLCSLNKYITSVPYEVILIDNLNFGEQFQSFCQQSHFKNVNLIKNSNPVSFSKNNNNGVRIAKYNRIILLNPDILVCDSSLNSLLMSWDEYIYDGLFFPSLYNEDGSRQVHSRSMPCFPFQVVDLLLTKLGLGIQKKPGNDWFYAAAVLFNKSDFYNIGGFDENFPMYAEDTEICHRAKRRGFKVELLEEVALIHKLGGEASGKYLKYAILSNFYLRFKVLKNNLDWLFSRMNLRS